MKKKTTTILIGILTGTMAILISGCSNNSSSQSIKNTSTSANTQAASSENTTASDIATTAVDSAESVTSIKSVLPLAAAILGRFSIVTVQLLMMKFRFLMMS